MIQSLHFTSTNKRRILRQNSRRFCASFYFLIQNTKLFSDFFLLYSFGCFSPMKYKYDITIYLFWSCICCLFGCVVNLFTFFSGLFRRLLFYSIHFSIRYLPIRLLFVRFFKFAIFIYGKSCSQIPQLFFFFIFVCDFVLQKNNKIKITWCK